MASSIISSFAPSPSARAVGVFVRTLVVLISTALPRLCVAEPLNDTGIITCYSASAVSGAVSPGTPDPEPVGFDEQDCTFGRAAADALGTLAKVGASNTSGRDYIKISNSGEILSDAAMLGAGIDDWGCTLDNVTGLTWEIKTTGENIMSPRYWRDMAHTYTWYDTDDTVNGGFAGFIAYGSFCANTLTNCNTTAYRDAINALDPADRLCGANDWRLPTAAELQSLVDYASGSLLFIDGGYFPNTATNLYWSGQNLASNPVLAGAWVVNFGDGVVAGNPKSDDVRVRLVRGGL